MLAPFVRHYILTTIAGAPDVLELLLEGIADTAPVWDNRPDPARFTLRAIVGHLADWNPVFLERVTRIRDEDVPSLLAQKPEEVAEETGSFRAAPAVSVARFRAGRAEMAAVFRALEPEQWERTGLIVGHPVASGAVSIESWIVQVAGHDGYHLQQVAQWLKR